MNPFLIIACFYYLQLPFSEKGLSYNCKKYKTGKFVCYHRNDNNIPEVIQRDSLFQKNISGDIEATQKIIWLSDTDYELYHLHSLSIDTLPNGNKFVYDYSGPEFNKERIIFCSSEYYIFEHTVLRNKIITDTMWVIK